MRHFFTLAAVVLCADGGFYLSSNLKKSVEPMSHLCPHSDPFQIRDVAYSAQEIIDTLTPMLTEERRQRMADVIAERSYAIVPVMEGLYDRGNVSAVLRSAEALGFQGVHIIESSEFFKEAKRVTQGAQKWLDIRSWDTTTPCIDHLREQGYRILATHFEDATPISEVDFSTPAALVFGNERDGVSPELLARADERVVIPMAGFAQSFNISVAAALCLYHIREARTRQLGAHGDLSAEERLRLTAEYYLRSVDNAEGVMARSRDA